MCKWGTSTVLKVKISADLSYTGKERWKTVGIDSCIAPIVKALQEGGIDMTGSCCGHGEQEGFVSLVDGRTLLVFSEEQYQDYISSKCFYK